MIFELVSKSCYGIELSNWRKFFDSIDYAKQFAEKDYCNLLRDADAKLEWIKKDEKQGIQTKNLGFITYHISPIKIKRNPVDRFTDRAKGYTHLAEFKPDEIIAARTPLGSRIKKPFTVADKQYMIHMDSERYHTFAKSKKCVCCGIEGTVMCLDRAVNSNPKDPPHFNLYAEKNGILILMTKDHIIPRTKNGPNHISNYQTMCNDCNEVKDNTDISVERLRQIIENNPEATREELKVLVKEDVKQICLEKVEMANA